MIKTVFVCDWCAREAPASDDPRRVAPDEDAQVPRAPTGSDALVRANNVVRRWEVIHPTTLTLDIAHRTSLLDLIAAELKT